MRAVAARPRMCYGSNAGFSSKTGPPVRVFRTFAVRGILLFIGIAYYTPSSLPWALSHFFHASYSGMRLSTSFQKRAE